MKFAAVEPPPRMRLSDAICSQIEQLIADGTLRPGECLPSERELARQLAVSRPSLREALLKMEVRGLLQVRRGGGYAVTDVMTQTITEPLAHLLNSYPKATADVIEMRQALGTIAAYYAALRATEADLEKLRTAFAALQNSNSRNNGRQEAEYDVEFHLVIAEASHNVAIVHVMHGIFNLLRKTVQHSREVLFEQHGSLALLDQQHKTLFEAICARDAEGARDAAQAHLEYVRANVYPLTRDGAG